MTFILFFGEPQTVTPEPVASSASVGSPRLVKRVPAVFSGGGGGGGISYDPFVFWNQPVREPWESWEVAPPRTEQDPYLELARKKRQAEYLEAELERAQGDLTAAKASAVVSLERIQTLENKIKKLSLLGLDIWETQTALLEEARLKTDEALGRLEVVSNRLAEVEASQVRADKKEQLGDLRTQEAQKTPLVSDPVVSDQVVPLLINLVNYLVSRVYDLTEQLTSPSTPRPPAPQTSKIVALVGIASILVVSFTAWHLASNRRKRKPNRRKRRL